MDTCFVITYRNADDGQVSTLRARHVGDSDLGPGFVCLSDFVFDTGGRVLLPTDEAMARRFENTRRLHLNVFSIQSIAEIGVANPGIHLQERSNVVLMPTPPFPKG